MRVLVTILAAAAIAAVATSTRAQVTSYTACADAPDPPECLVRKAVAVDPDDVSEILKSAVVTGSADLLMADPDRTLKGSAEAGASVDAVLRAFGVELEQRPGAAASARRDILLAGILLAALAAHQVDPFADSRVTKLAPTADDQAIAAVIAAELWDEIDPYRDFGAVGRSSVWRRIVGSPPASDERLVDLAHSALSSGYREQGLALLEVLRARPAATPDSQAQAASVLARIERRWAEALALMDAGGDRASGYDVEGIRASIAAARLSAGYDAPAAAAVLRAELAKIPDNGFYDYSISETLEPLGRARATAELGRLGDAYLGAARNTGLSDEDRTDWYAMASEAYRLAGRRDEALAAAREGVRLVPTAIHRRASPPMRPDGAPASQAVPQTDQERLQELVDANGFGGKPVVALYRAGERDEARATGYLSGFDRFRNAEVAGETPDAAWVVDDRSWFWVEVQTLGLDGDPVGAARLHDRLAAARALYPDIDDGAWETQLGVLAGMAGRREQMANHFRRAAEDLDRTLALPDPEDAKASAYFALELATLWETGLRRTAPR